MRDIGSGVGIALIAAILAGGTACHKADKAGQLKALDSAYASGVFTKQEYDAKRQAILGTPAPAPVTAPATPPVPKPSPVGSPVTPPQAAAPPAVTAPSADKVETVPPTPSRTPAPPPPSPKQDAREIEAAPSAGCEDADYRAGGSKSMQRVFPESPAAVHAAALRALEKLDFVIHSDDGHDIEASKRRHLSAVVGAGGERVILHIASTRVGTRVSGETRKSFVGRLSQKSWTSAVLAQIACNLKR